MTSWRPLSDLDNWPPCAWLKWVDVNTSSSDVSLFCVSTCWDPPVWGSLSLREGSCQQTVLAEGQCPCWLSAGWDALRGQTAPSLASRSAECLPEPCRRVDACKWQRSGWTKKKTKTWLRLNLGSAFFRVRVPCLPKGPSKDSPASALPVTKLTLSHGSLGVGDGGGDVVGGRIRHL